MYSSITLFSPSHSESSPNQPFKPQPVQRELSTPINLTKTIDDRLLQRTTDPRLPYLIALTNSNTTLVDIGSDGDEERATVIVGEYLRDHG